MLYHSLFYKGIITLEDLIGDTNKVLIKQNPNALTLTPLEWFQLIQIFDALLTQWQTSLTSCGPKSGKAFVLNDHMNVRTLICCSNTGSNPRNTGMFRVKRKKG